MSWLEPVTLTGTHATLVPLAPEHASALGEASSEDELWRVWYTNVPSAQGMAAEIERRLGLQRAGSMLAFTVRDANARPVGMTTFMHVDATHKRVEIGSTWYARSVQRSALNTECKLMLLGHAPSMACAASLRRPYRGST